MRFWWLAFLLVPPVSADVSMFASFGGNGVGTGNLCDGDLVFNETPGWSQCWFVPQTTLGGVVEPMTYHFQTKIPDGRELHVQGNTSFVLVFDEPSLAAGQRTPIPNPVLAVEALLSWGSGEGPRLALDCPALPPPVVCEGTTQTEAVVLPPGTLLELRVTLTESATISALSGAADPGNTRVILEGSWREVGEHPAPPTPPAAGVGTANRDAPATSFGPILGVVLLLLHRLRRR